MLGKRLRLALPFTVLSEPGVVRLVAGEDHRYALTAPDLELWLPALLARLDGRVTVAEALPVAQRERALALLLRLLSERVLIEGTAVEAHAPRRCRLELAGRGSLRDRLASEPSGEGPDRLRLLCQDRLDHHELITEGRRARGEGLLFLWASTGPLARGFVSPVFLPDAGPCPACLLAHFRRLSPAPEVQDALLAHARAGRTVEPVPFPDAGVDALAALARWKVALLGEPLAPAALYRLHVLEVETLEVSAHRALLDDECEEHG